MEIFSPNRILQRQAAVADGHSRRQIQQAEIGQRLAGGHNELPVPRVTRTESDRPFFGWRGAIGGRGFRGRRRLAGLAGQPRGHDVAELVRGEPRLPRRCSRGRLAVEFHNDNTGDTVAGFVAFRVACTEPAHFIAQAVKGLH
jgi:hypothetical protein